MRVRMKAFDGIADMFLFFVTSLCVMVISGDNVTSSTEPTSAEAPPPPPASPEALYDSPKNLRHHHRHTWGPQFEPNTTKMSHVVREGENVYLDCHVTFLEDKMVSWFRLEAESELMDLLTLGTKNHIEHPRIFSDFKYPNNWRLAIRNANRSDSGTYLCQISTHPTKNLYVQLIVQAPEVFIVNSRGERITEVHYKEGSTLQLICVVNYIKSKSVSWYRNTDLLNHDVSRGGVGIKTNITADHATSILNVVGVTRKDGGTYLCSTPAQNAKITVHVLNGENPAELYLNKAPSSHPDGSWSLRNCVLLIFVLWVKRMI